MVTCWERSLAYTIVPKKLSILYYTQYIFIIKYREIGRKPFTPGVVPVSRLFSPSPPSVSLYIYIYTCQKRGDETNSPPCLSLKFPLRRVRERNRGEKYNTKKTTRPFLKRPRCVERALVAPWRLFPPLSLSFQLVGVCIVVYICRCSPSRRLSFSRHSVLGLFIAGAPSASPCAGAMRSAPLQLLPLSVPPPATILLPRCMFYKRPTSNRIFSPLFFFSKTP